MKGKEWRLELNKAEVRLTEGKEKATIRGHEADLGGKVLVEDGRVLVPLAAALPLLSRLLNTAVDFHQPSRRIFVGNTFTRFTADFKDGESPSLVLNFTPAGEAAGYVVMKKTAADLFTHTDKTTLTFRKDPLVSEINKQQFGDGAIQSLTFTEENGAASITVTGNAKLQIIRSEDGKTITLQPRGSRGRGCARTCPAEHALRGGRPAAHAGVFCDDRPQPWRKRQRRKLWRQAGGKRHYPPAGARAAQRTGRTRDRSALAARYRH